MCASVMSREWPWACRAVYRIDVNFSSLVGVCKCREMRANFNTTVCVLPTQYSIYRATRNTRHDLTAHTGHRT